MLSPEEKQVHVARHQLLLAEMKRRGFSNAEGSEAQWEQTLAELSGGRYDAVLGLRILVAELQAANDKQAFLDAVVVKIMGGLGDPDDYAKFAKQAYDQAEALWEERRRRQQGLPYEEPKPKGIPF